MSEKLIYGVNRSPSGPFVCKAGACESLWERIAGSGKRQEQSRQGKPQENHCPVSRIKTKESSYGNCNRNGVGRGPRLSESDRHRRPFPHLRPRFPDPAMLERTRGNFWSELCLAFKIRSLLQSGHINWIGKWPLVADSGRTKPRYWAVVPASFAEVASVNVAWSDGTIGWRSWPEKVKRPAIAISYVT
jgi:hypothetical protein